MTEHQQDQMQTLIYALTKNAARDSYREFLEDWGISKEDYDQLKVILKERLGVTPYV